MDHSGLDRELINSPLACWDSRQGELSASSVSGRARGEWLQTNCTKGQFKQGPAGLEHVYVALCEFRPPAPQAAASPPLRENPFPRHTRQTALGRKRWQITITTEWWITSYQVESIDWLRNEWVVLLYCRSMAVWSLKHGMHPVSFGSTTSEKKNVICYIFGQNWSKSVTIDMN